METKFYCNKCRNEVAPSTVRCPYCGENFNAVKCPVCNLVGKPVQFRNGCPSCGYMNPNQEIGNIAHMKKESKKRKARKRRKESLFHFDIPAEGYKIILVILILILFFLFYLVYRLL